MDVDNSVDTLGSEDLASPEGSTKDSQAGSAPQGGLSQADILELDKLEKFKYQGRDWTPRELERAILRQQDYSKKTAEIAEERKALQARADEQKFYENLHYDLRKIESNPALISEFLRVYPEKFHQYAREFLGSTSQNQAQQKPQPTSHVDFETQQRMLKLEKHFEEQEVAKNLVEINSTIDSLSKKYPDALAELAIVRVNEAANKGTKITEKLWEDAFRQVDAEMKNIVKAKYGDLVKKQTEANKKAQDVPSGGGTLSKAPENFKSLKDVTKYAINDIKSRS